MESLFYLRWDKGREAMAAQQRKDKFNLIPFFENGRNQLNYLSLCGRAAQRNEWMNKEKKLILIDFFDLWLVSFLRSCGINKTTLFIPFLWGGYGRQQAAKGSAKGRERNERELVKLNGAEDKQKEWTKRKQLEFLCEMVDEINKWNKGMDCFLLCEWFTKQFHCAASSSFFFCGHSFGASKRRGELFLSSSLRELFFLLSLFFAAEGASKELMKRR